jgi:Fungal specific transcription factor domain
LKCDGYAQTKEDTRRKNLTAGAGKLLLPKDGSRVVTSTPISIARAPTTKTHATVDQALSSFPSTPRLFKSQQEYHFHQLFCSKVAKELSGFFPSKVWRQCVLQAAEAEPFLFDAVIAIGALHKSLTEIINEVPDLKDVEVHRRSNIEHNFALERYHHSLGCMRKALAEGKMEARTALIACLLTVCFDNFYGSRDTAMFNMISGVKLAKRIAYTTATGALPDLEPTPITIPTATSVEDELVSIFTRLDVTSMVFIDHRSIDEHRVMKDSLDQAARFLPAKYALLEDAVRDGEMIMARCWHFIKIMQEMGQRFFDIVNYFTQAAQHRWSRVRIRYGWNPWTDSEEPVPAEWVAESEQCVCEIEQWLTAFEPLLRKFQSPPVKYSAQLLHATLLSLQAKFTMISVRSAVYRREREWDVHLSEFQEVVALAEIYLAAQPKRFYTSFESDTLVILAYLIWKCRDGDVRRRALKLLDDHPRREAAWDSRYCSISGRWIMDIEEGERGPSKCSEIKEEQRMKVFALDYDSVEGSIRTWACQMTTDGEKVKHDFLWN